MGGIGVGIWWRRAGVITLVASALVPLPSGTVAASINTGATPLSMARAIFADDSVVTAAAFEHHPGGSPHAIVSNALGGMPTQGLGYLVMTTGSADLLDNANTSDSSGVDLGGPNVRGTTDFDVSVFKIDFDVPDNANCLVGMDFRFLSEEYPEYVGSAFNDAFIAELDVSDWTTSGSQITAPHNFAFDPQGDPITINTSGATSMSRDEAVGTTYDGATPLLRAATPITPGSHSLHLSIFDQGDNVLDSAVIIDNVRLGRVANVETDCRSGAVLADPSYVAFGDSITTGQSIRLCNYDLEESKYGCRGTPPGVPPPARPYPEIVADVLGPPVGTSLNRVGIWGYTVQQAADAHPGELVAGRWSDQFSEVEDAQELVTGALGINDMGFSDPWHWFSLYRTWRAKGHADEHVDDLDKAFDEMFESLERAQANGATVVVTLYYNPFGRDRLLQIGGTNGCSTTHGIADVITGRLNRELRERAEAAGFLVADFKEVFEGHGSGEDDSWVFGSRCDGSGALQAWLPDWDQSDADGKRGIEERFDPHPNGKGTRAMAEEIIRVVGR